MVSPVPSCGVPAFVPYLPFHRAECFATKEECVRKRFFMGGLVAAAAAAIALAMVGIAGSATKDVTPLPASACGNVQYGGSGSPDFIVPSDLPLQGAIRTQTDPDLAGDDLGNSPRRAGRPGRTRSATSPATTRPHRPARGTRAKCAANARLYARNKSVIGVLGTFNSGCAKIEVPIMNRATRPARHGQPGEHEHRTDEEVGIRVSRRSTTRPGSGTTPASSPPTTSRARPTRS